jgi:hypothetical protein
LRPDRHIDCDRPRLRSGAIAALSPGSPRVEIVLGLLVTVTADDIHRWFADHAAAGGSGSISPAWQRRSPAQTIAAALVPLAIRLTGVGTPTASLAALGGSRRR